MFKRFIKKQIKKTGMVKEIEINNHKLQSRLIDMKTTNRDLQVKIRDMQVQIEDLEKINLDYQETINSLNEINKNLKEKEMNDVGFSLKTNLRGISADTGKPVILKYILDNISKDSKILDIGFGSGIYGKLLRSFLYQNIDGLDVYGENIELMGLDKIYDNIYITNILEFDFEHYDLIILGDVLEHIDLKNAKKLISDFIEMDKCDHMIVSIPYEYEQDEAYGNKHEKHLQPDVNEDYMAKHYPNLKLIELESIPNSNSMMAFYVWNNEMYN